MEITFKEKIFMFLRKSPIKQIQRASDILDQIGCSESIIDLEAHTLAGGDIVSVAKAAEELKNNNVNFDVFKLKVFDLAGKDLNKIVRFWIENKSKSITEIEKIVWKTEI